MTRLNDFLSCEGTLTVADLTNRKTQEAGHNSRRPEDILREFRAARTNLLDRVGQLPTACFARSLLHPRLKHPMRLVDHLYFVAEHDDHHLAYIWEIVSR